MTIIIINNNNNNNTTTYLLAPYATPMTKKTAGTAAMICGTAMLLRLVQTRERDCDIRERRQESTRRKGRRKDADKKQNERKEKEEEIVRKTEISMDTCRLFFHVGLERLEKGVEQEEEEKKQEVIMEKEKVGAGGGGAGGRSRR
eukprot:163156-Hanusia_phi.AAC.1